MSDLVLLVGSLVGVLCLFYVPVALLPMRIGIFTGVLAVGVSK